MRRITGARKRTFQLLAQAVGRAGRGDREGEAVIQTYHPDHYSIVSAARQDYEEFYEEEILYRRLLSYPPASHMMAVLGTGEDEKLLQNGHGLHPEIHYQVYSGEDLKIDRSGGPEREKNK